MTIDENTTVVQTGARITAQRFAEILRDNDSPATPEAEQGWQVVKDQDVDPLFALAIFQHESRFGRVGICATHQTHSPGNTRSSRTGVGQVIETDRGQFVRYPSWTEGWRDLARRLVDPSFVYVMEGRRTIRRVIERWAPAGDLDNQPNAYVAAVIQRMSEWSTTGFPAPPIKDRPLPGHFGRGRPAGLKPVLIVIHIQEGRNDLFTEFKNRVEPNLADSTIWNRREDDAPLERFLSDEDTAWTNGPWSQPNLANPVIKDLFNRDISTNDVSLTIEHAGFHTKGITDAQFERTVLMCAHWCDKWGIPPTRQHIIGHGEVGSHKLCPGLSIDLDRLVGRVQRALNTSVVTCPDFAVIPISYRVIVPAFKATVRRGPGRGCPIVTTLNAHATRKYQVDGEAHGEMIGSDDVWSHLLDEHGQPLGWVTRTALHIVH